MARLFNGTSDGAKTATLSLSTYSSLSLGFWMWWDTFANNDKLACEFGGTNYLGNGFIVDPNATNGGTSRFNFGIGIPAGSASWVDEFARPSAGAWHHYVLTMNRATPVNVAYVDGVLQTLFTTVHNAGTYGNFNNSTLSLMSRNNVSLRGAGRLADFTIWGGVLLTAGNAAALATGAAASSVRPDGIVYRPPLYGDSSEPDYSGFRIALTLTGTSVVNHPRVQPGLLLP